MSVYEPFVIYEAGPQVIVADPCWKMWYANLVDTKIYYAESADGLTWTKYGSPTPIIDQAHARPTVIKTGGVYYLFVYESGNLTRYHSSNGVTSWTDDGTVLAKGTGADWDANGIQNTAIIIDGSDWIMLYEASATATPTLYKIGLATSSDGATWSKYGSNPVINFYPSGMCGGPFLTKVGSIYYCWHQYCTSGEWPTDIMKCKSTDLHTWTPVPTVFKRKSTGEGPGSSSGQVADPCILEVGSNIYMYYDATDDQDPFTIRRARLLGQSFSTIAESFEV